MKYHKDSEFTDPVLRCDSCSDLVRLEDLKKQGKCHCGNRKVRSLLTIKDEAELAQMREWNTDKDFMKLFAYFIDCDECAGSGRIGDSDEPCEVCDGHGDTPGRVAHEC